MHPTNASHKGMVTRLQVHGWSNQVATISKFPPSLPLSLFPQLLYETLDKKESVKNEIEDLVKILKAEDAPKKNGTSDVESR